MLNYDNFEDVEFIIDGQIGIDRQKVVDEREHPTL